MTIKPISLDECIDALRKKAATGTMNWETVMHATDSLRSPEDIRAYLQAYVAVTVNDIRTAIKKKDADNDAIRKVKTGTPIRNVATWLVYDHLNHLLGKYGSSEHSCKVHESWDPLVEELRTAF